MDDCQPLVRRRGFFLHSSDAEGGHEMGEHDNPEGVSVRVRLDRSPAPRQFASSGRQVRDDSRGEDTRPQIRSGSVTGSRQRAHLPR